MISRLEQWKAIKGKLPAIPKVRGGGEGGGIIEITFLSKVSYIRIILTLTLKKIT